MKFSASNVSALLRRLAKLLAHRLKEPSSWAGVAGGLTMLGVNVDPGVAQSVMYVLSGICGLLAFFIPEESLEHEEHREQHERERP